MNCSSSPNGEHKPYPTEIEVIVKGEKKKMIMVIACWWCGAIL